MIEQRKNVMIAIFTIAAFAIIVFIIMFLNPNVGDDAKVLRVRFADIDKITRGTRVNFSGKPVGEVVDVVELLGDRGQRIVHNGIVYPYELILAIDSDITVYRTDEITSRTSGLLGEKSVAITPLPLPKGELPQEATEETLLFAIEAGSVETTLKDFKELSDKVELTIDSLIDAFTTLKKQNAWENLGLMVDNFRSIAESLNKPQQLAAILDNVKESSDNLKVLSSDIIAGKGTLGELLVKENLYLQLSSMLSKAETTLDDINHYGLLFHLDKGWKRLRARRLNLMEQLSSPQQFRNYFNDEIVNINTALARVTMVIKQTTTPPGQLWQNPEYAKVYAELLRRVARLEEYLEMYNQQVVDGVVKQTELSENP